MENAQQVTEQYLPEVSEVTHFALEVGHVVTEAASRWHTSTLTLTHNRLTLCTVDRSV